MPQAPARRTLSAIAHTTRRTLLAVAGLTVIAVALVWLIISVGILVLRDRQDRHVQERREAGGQVVIADVYRALNDINSQLAAIQDKPAPAPINPPLIRRPVTAPNRPATTRSSRAQPSTPSTTTTAVPKPTTTTTGTTAPPRTTTTTACPLAVQGRCVPAGPPTERKHQ